MADTKISALTALTGSNLASGDKFPVVDVSATETKYILKSELDTVWQPFDSDLTSLSTKWTAPSSSGPATLVFNEDTDNGSNKVTVTAPASLSADYTATLAALTGTLMTNSSGNVLPVFLEAACSDETTAISAATDKLTFRNPFGATLTVTAVRCHVKSACTTGTFTVDINDSGTTILSTKLTLDATEKTSTTAATPPVISDSSIADDAIISVDVDNAGDGTATGLKVVIIGTIPLA